MSRATLYQGECLDVMRGMASGSVDSVVTDPPYALTAVSRNGSPRQNDPATPHGRTRLGGGFMGKTWDAQLPGVDVWTEVLRVAKPGAHLVAFGGTRTFHRLTCAIEDAGWEIRDCLSWIFGSGFPKSLDVGKAMDKAAGRQREVTRPGVRHSTSEFDPATSSERERRDAPATDLARQWDGWGTALKPGWEPIILARKPLTGTVAQNVAEHGTGAINIDGCRIKGPTDPRKWGGTQHTESPTFKKLGGDGEFATEQHPGGRWPANVALDVDAAALLDQQSGEGRARGNLGVSKGGGGLYGHGLCLNDFGAGDSGGASRFFYTAKASRAEREAGLRDVERKAKLWSSGTQNPGSFQAEGTDRTSTNHHPTVKPIALMRWLCRLVTPPGGLILDPFMGSGTTGCAAELEGFDFVGIEREAEYMAIARARLAHWANVAADQPLSLDIPA